MDKSEKSHIESVTKDGVWIGNDLVKEDGMGRACSTNGGDEE
jgi:hypothetical protein